jgi:hypothetical protein
MKRQTKGQAYKKVVERGTHNLARAQLQEAMPGLDHSYGLHNRKKQISPRLYIYILIRKTN